MKRAPRRVSLPQPPTDNSIPQPTMISQIPQPKQPDPIPEINVKFSRDGMELETLKLKTNEAIMDAVNYLAHKYNIPLEYCIIMVNDVNIPSDASCTWGSLEFDVNANIATKFTTILTFMLVDEMSNKIIDPKIDMNEKICDTLRKLPELTSMSATNTYFYVGEQKLKESDTLTWKQKHGKGKLLKIHCLRKHISVEFHNQDKSTKIMVDRETEIKLGLATYTSVYGKSELIFSHDGVITLI